MGRRRRRILHSRNEAGVPAAAPSYLVRCKVDRPRVLCNAKQLNHAAGEKDNDSLVLFIGSNAQLVAY